MHLSQSDFSFNNGHITKIHNKVSLLSQFDLLPREPTELLLIQTYCKLKQELNICPDGNIHFKLTFYYPRYNKTHDGLQPASQNSVCLEQLKKLRE